MFLVQIIFLSVTEDAFELEDLLAKNTVTSQDQDKIDILVSQMVKSQRNKIRYSIYIITSFISNSYVNTAM